MPKPLYSLKRKQRLPQQREADLALISRYYLRGYDLKSIAARVSEERPYKISFQSVSRDLQELHARWLKSSLIDIDTAKKQELERLRLLEEQYWEAWESSRKVTTQTETESTQDTQGESRTYARERSKTKITQRDGTATYLAGIERCIEMRCKILGLLAPQKFQAVDWQSAAKDAGVPETVAVQQFEELVAKYQSALDE